MFSMKGTSPLSLVTGARAGGVWQGAAGAPAAELPVLSSGWAALDGVLAGGGLPVGGVTDIRCQPGVGGLTLALRVCAVGLQSGAVARVALVDPGGVLHGPGVLEAGIPPGRLWCVRPKDPRRACGLALRLTRSGAFGVVVLDLLAHAPAQAPLQVRRLAVAAQDARVAVLILAGPWAESSSLPLPAALRLSLFRPARHLLGVQVDKQRGSSAQPRVILQRPGLLPPGWAPGPAEALQGPHNAEAPAPRALSVG